MKNEPLKKFLSAIKIPLLVLLSFTVYYITARLGLELATINKQASPIWPASGLAISMVLLFGPRVAIGIFVAAFLTNYQTGLNIMATVGIACGNTLEALFFVLAFKKISKGKTFDIYTRSIVGIAILVLAAAISATFGSASLWITAVIPAQAFAKNWTTWWIGDLLGALFIAPIAYTYVFSKMSAFKLRPIQMAIFFVILFILISLNQFIFVTDGGKPYLFLIFLPILLSAVWLETAWVYAISILICIFSVWRTIQGQGPFSGGELNDNLVNLQIFLAGVGITSVGIGNLKQEQLGYKTTIALLAGWFLSGMTFYFSFIEAEAKDNIRFQSEIERSQNAIDVRMKDYIRMLESGVSFFNASDYVSEAEWHLFANKLLSTNQYPGVEGFGAIFSESISSRFSSDRQTKKYQPAGKIHPLKGIAESDRVLLPDENFIISYVEPSQFNKVVIGLNVSTEKHRYEAAKRARDTGSAAMTDSIQLVQDSKSRPGFLLFVPVYKSGAEVLTIQQRRNSLVGFVYAPVVFENFLKTVLQPFEDQIILKVYGESGQGKLDPIYQTENSMPSSISEVSKKIVLAGKTINLTWQRGKKFETTVSLISTWIGFFSTIATLFFAIMLSSAQTLKDKAQKLAVEITKELQIQKRNWQVLTETSPVGIFLTDKVGNCTYVNPAWTKMTGLSMQQAVGNGWITALHPDDLEIVMENWKRLMSGGNFACNYRFIKRNGDLVYVAGQALPIKDEKEEKTGYFGTVQDITELYLNQIAVVSASKMSSLGEMASGIAHEINNPLTIIQGKALILEKMIEQHSSIDILKAKKTIEQIGATIQRIVKIIKGLRAFARDTTSEPFQRSSIKEAIDDTLELCRERFVKHETNLITKSHFDNELFFMGRSEQISQVLLNVLNNAFDAVQSAKEKWVKVETRLDEARNEILISVSDSGPGVPPSMRGKIFDPFYTTKDVGKGTGLGLSISRGIIAKHKGRIYIDDSMTHSTFVIELPRIVDESKAIDV